MTLYLKNIVVVLILLYISNLVLISCVSPFPCKSYTLGKLVNFVLDTKIVPSGKRHPIVLLNLSVFALVF